MLGGSVCATGQLKNLQSGVQEDSRWDDRAEPRSLDCYPSVGSPAYRRDFRADMFPFSVTIGPYHEQVGVARFSLQV